MRTRLVSAAGAVVLAATLLVTAAAPAGAFDRPNVDRSSRHARWSHGATAAPELNIVHGIPDLPVDIYISKNLSSVRVLKNVNFGATAELNAALPGFISTGFYRIEVVAAGENPRKPLLRTRVRLRPGDSKSVVAYVAANAKGTPRAPRLGVFANDLSSVDGQSRVTVRHLAVAPTVGVYANNTVPITPAFSNGETATAVVPASSYGVTVTAPNKPGTVLKDLNQVALAANTNTLAFAVGTYPDTFTVVALPLPTR